MLRQRTSCWYNTISMTPEEHEEPLILLKFNQEKHWWLLHMYIVQTFKPQKVLLRVTPRRWCFWLVTVGNWIWNSAHASLFFIYSYSFLYHMVLVSTISVYMKFNIFLRCWFIVIFIGYWFLSWLKPKIHNTFIFIIFFICLHQYLNHMVSFFSFFRFAGVFCGNKNYNINLFNKMHTGKSRIII